VQLAEVFLVVDVLSSEIFRKVSLPHIGHCLIQGKPIELSHKFLDIFSIEVAGAIDTLLDLDDEREVILLALGDVTDEKVMGKESHWGMLIYFYYIINLKSSLIYVVFGVDSNVRLVQEYRTLFLLL
jgi:hypothetical protein